MRFYKQLAPFRVISFDLDDTLYDNTQIILHAERQFIAYLQQRYRLPRHADFAYWQHCRQQVLASDRGFNDDVTLLRSRVIRTGLQHLGHAITHAEVAELTEIFITMRSDITVSREVLQLLRDLQARYVLAALSNGNVSLERLGLSHIFSLNLRPSYQKLRRKPHADLFNLLSRQLRVPLGEILHVGDEPYADVRGAVLAGCQSAFLDRGFAGKLPSLEALSNLPHVVLTNIFELRSFI